MKRVLFVDDDRHILDGLQRMLYGRRKEWEMSFVTSGDEALRSLDASNFDVIVTDMRMPALDGATLLEQVQKRHPGVIRIVLSGDCDVKAGIRAVPVAHQFLMKPCNSDVLAATIERLCCCGEILAHEGTRRVVASLGELPALPRTYSALTAALLNADSPLREIGSIIERDVGVAAKVLQLANSAFFGRSREIHTIATAVGFLGIDVLKHLVLGIELFRTFQPNRRLTGFSAESLQLHSARVAAMARHLPLPAKDSQSASMAALLHDSGKLILATQLPDRFEELLRTSRANQVPLYKAEEQAEGATHADIGAYLLAIWGLPAAVVNAVAGHHRPQVYEGKALSIGLVVHMADLLVNEAEAEADVLGDFWTAKLDQLGLGPELAAWREAAREVVAGGAN